MYLKRADESEQQLPCQSHHCKLILDVWQKPDAQWTHGFVWCTPHVHLQGHMSASSFAMALPVAMLRIGI